MVRTVIFDDEITLWWEYALTKEEKRLDCFLDGAYYTQITSTHVSFTGLRADTEYTLQVRGGQNVVFEGVLRTKKAKNRLDVSKPPFNAIGDGKTLNTQALQRALDACTETDYVYIPAGVFLTGALRLHDDTELYLARGCVLQGTENLEDYLPKIRSRFEGLELDCYASLLNAGELDSQGGANCKNIVIRGAGRIVGGGNPLRQKVIAVENARLKEYVACLGEKIQDFETTDTLAARFRGRLVNISNVDNVVITGLAMENSPSWNLHTVYSTNLTIYGCAFISHDIGNGDGIDPDSVENCAIFGCAFDTSDDCIAIKSGRNPEGNVVNRRSANIYIFDCIAAGHSICVGSEISGGVENVYIWDCDMRGTVCGVQLKYTKKRGGYIKNVFVNRCKISRVLAWCVGYNDDGESASTISKVSDFYVEDCELYSGPRTLGIFFKYVLLRGVDEENPLRKVHLNNITLKNHREGDQVFLSSYTENVVFNYIIKE